MTTEDLRATAAELGLAGFGVTSAAPFGEAKTTMEKLKGSGYAGPLHFTYDDPDTATDVSASAPWARSLVVFAHNYLPTSQSPRGLHPQVGRFATHDQYQSLREAAQTFTQALRDAGHKAETFIDDVRLADRAPALRSGVGWRGRSTMVLIPGHGPWTLLGAVATDALLEPTEPTQRSCGTCVACIPACPTGAIKPDGLDASRCISTWLQTPGRLPHWIRPIVGTRIYGCDDCLTSCPPGHPQLELYKTQSSSLDFADLLGLSDQQLLDRFSWWYVPDRDPRFLRRNVVVAVGNSGEQALHHLLEVEFGHRSSLVRGHAYWAYARLLGLRSWETLRGQLDAERSQDAVWELEHAFLMLRLAPSASPRRDPRSDS